MRKRGLILVLLTIMLAGALGPVLLSPPSVGADEAPATAMRPDRITASTKYPSVSGAADTRFTFQIELMYELTDVLPGGAQADTGRLQARIFDFELDGPPGWRLFVAESAWQLDKRIGAMQLRALGVPTNVTIVATAPWWTNLEPGNYPIGLRVASRDGAIEDSLELQAVVTAWYGIDAATSTGRLNTKTVAGQPATFDLVIANTGSDTLDKVAVSSSRPTGIANQQWQIRFDPDAIIELAPGDQQQITVSITPPEKAISGDYYVTLNFSGDPNISDNPPSLEMRVTVDTQPVWVMSGILIVILAFGGLLYSFYALRKR